MRDAENLALDRALQEVVGGDTPSDRTFQIAAAVIAARSGQARRRRVSNRTLWGGGLVGAAAALFAAVTLWPEVGSVPELSVLVLDGGVTWLQPPQKLHGNSSEFITVVPRIADRVVSHPLTLTRLDVAPFGTLQLASGTTLEIVDMEWKQFGIGFGTGTITVGVLAGAVQWISGESVTSASAGETSKLTMDRPAETMRGTTKREQELVRDLEAAKRELKQLRQESARTPIEQPVQAEPVTESSEDEDEFRPFVGNAALQSLFDEADWKGVAQSTLDLTELTRELFELLVAGEPMTLEMQGELRRIEGILHKYAARIDNEESIEGMSFETKVRHPIVGSNWLAATLKAAKYPLSDEQRTGLANLASQYAREDAQRRAEYREDVSDVEKYLDEMELQDRFYAETRSHLTPAQVDLLYPGKFKGRSGSSPIGEGSAAWHDWVQSPSYATKADFVDGMTGSWSRGLELDATQRKGLQKIMQSWIDAYPASLWSSKDRLARYGFHDVDRIRQSARLQLKYFQEMATSLQLSPKQIQYLRKTHTIIVPYKK